MTASLTLRRAGRALRNPAEAMRYLAVQLRKRRDPAGERGRLFEFLSRHYDTDAERTYAEYLTSTFRQWYRRRLHTLAREPGARRGTSSTFDCEVLYLLVRAMKPRVVVETGVLHGGSSAHLLQAVAENGVGEVYSIDFEGEPGMPRRDYLIPSELRAGWRFVAGDIKEVLSELLAGIGGCDLFHHDSLHSYEHMMWEYETARRWLRAGGVISSHDVIAGPWGKNAFADFCAREAATHSVFRNLGIALLGTPGPAVSASEIRAMPGGFHVVDDDAKDRGA
jgi:predicted O-methyltransferase YrrM